ncbi:hypothetical protein [Enterobacter cloacae complex sp. 302F9]|uniref:hypothetical protein n=1 Tax=Enterobacter cloacae complex sp. 302F9 TaxID=3395821 RepID=UPI003CF5D27A
MPLLYFHFIKLEQIFYIWLVFSAISVAVGVISIVKFESVSISDFKLDVQWLKRRVRKLHSFFFGTLCLRVINYLDKVIAVHFIKSPNLGVYVFFFGVAAAVQAIIDVLVVTRYYPSLVKAIQANNLIEAKKAFVRFKKRKFSCIILGFTYYLFQPVI